MRCDAMRCDMMIVERNRTELIDREQNIGGKFLNSMKMRADGRFLFQAEADLDVSDHATRWKEKIYLPIRTQ